MEGRTVHQFIYLFANTHHLLLLELKAHHIKTEFTSNSCHSHLSTQSMSLAPFGFFVCLLGLRFYFVVWGFWVVLNKCNLKKIKHLKLISSYCVEYEIAGKTPAKNKGFLHSFWLQVLTLLGWHQIGPLQKKMGLHCCFQVKTNLPVLNAMFYILDQRGVWNSPSLHTSGQ